MHNSIERDVFIGGGLFLNVSPRSLRLRPIVLDRRLGHHDATKNCHH